MGSELIIFDCNSFLFFDTIMKLSKPYTQIAIYADLNEKLTEFDFYSTIHFKNRINFRLKLFCKNTYLIKKFIN